MYFFYRIADKDLINNKVKVLAAAGSVYRYSQWNNPARVVELDILVNVGGQTGDYAWYLEPNPPAGIGATNVKEVILSLDGQGNPAGISSWSKMLTLTGAMQVTVSNGPYGSETLDLALVDRQVNFASDPTYDFTFDLYVIKADVGGAIDLALCYNDAAPPAGWSSVQKILSGVLPAGCADLAPLNLF